MRTPLLVHVRALCIDAEALRARVLYHPPHQRLGHTLALERFGGLRMLGDEQIVPLAPIFQTGYPVLAGDGPDVPPAFRIVLALDLNPARRIPCGAFAHD